MYSALFAILRVSAVTVNSIYWTLIFTTTNGARTQLKVQKTEVNVETEDFLESLSDQERRIAHDLIMKHRARRGLKTSGSSWMMTEDGQSSQSSSRSVNPAAAGTFESNDAV